MLYCVHCTGEIPGRSQNPNQKYCQKRKCQNARKQLSKARRRGDPEFRKAEKHDQKKWRERHPDYMQEYREKHPEYVEKNRQEQRKRNRRRDNDKSPPEGRLPVGAGTLIVNGDAWKGLVGLGFIKTIEIRGDEVIVNGDASNPLVPMVLLPKTLIHGMVKATREWQVPKNNGPGRRRKDCK